MAQELHVMPDVARGGWLVALLAAVTTALIERLMRGLDRRGLPLFFQQVAGAAVATGVAVLLVARHVEVRSSVVVAAGIVVLLAGLSLVGAAQDAISGFPVTAAARAFEVMTLTPPHREQRIACFPSVVRTICGARSPAAA